MTCVYVYHCVFKGYLFYVISEYVSYHVQITTLSIVRWLSYEQFTYKSKSSVRLKIIESVYVGNRSSAMYKNAAYGCSDSYCIVTSMR